MFTSWNNFCNAVDKKFQMKFCKYNIFLELHQRNLADKRRFILYQGSTRFQYGLLASFRQVSNRYQRWYLTDILSSDIPKYFGNFRSNFKCGHIT